mmetsp:Transcript_254/g.353  ORF Transcript_254/g.353 Transcript_254/m.353 type:complete len:249 (+) Transcript_254:59-805(+)|eukprot:CAMPEP_0197292016 /NCGR_PEP_ID=MMETSP0890-20130614/20846_1 /TAXON_ID=44058 ORGANISM="Aureoumbra lagunensis, Strain CCMP1510" /NCGR_SAMPLE_ID=MMETSP0890 /ASSEMBLY_ACC=CAM_ASM_000533 /LENGTH=248 /DNA_ID=CAMNT_0042765583 /DNA_START=46 /DNA_END=792 /DNA_ORIENTATION=+
MGTVWDAGRVDATEIYVGSLAAAEDISGLTEHGVARILTMAARLRVQLPTSIDAHLQIDIDDHPAANLLEKLPAALTFLDSIDPVLCHCASGVSRSAATVMAWLITRHGFDYDSALTATRQNRSHVDPNIGFKTQLQLLADCGGNLDQARARWLKSGYAINPQHRAIRRRNEANEAHQRIDAFEERLQTARSRKDDLTPFFSAFMCECAALDRARINNDGGLPEDKVAASIFKAARAKLERLGNELNI